MVNKQKQNIMISRTVKVSLCLVALCTITMVNAQERRGKKRANPEALFKTLDTNTDGELSLEEFTSQRQREELKAEAMNDRFKILDSDANGSLSMEEFQSRKEVSKEERIAQHFAKMDSNGDGNVNLEEYTAFLENTKRYRNKGKHRRPKKQD